MAKLASGPSGNDDWVEVTMGVSRLKQRSKYPQQSSIKSLM
jgi:hypothetical protein